MKNKLILYCLFIELCFSLLEAGHSNRITDISVSNDREYYVTSSKEGKIIIWDNNHEMKSLFTHDSSKSIMHISLSYNNKLLAIGNKGGSIDIINIESNESHSLHTGSKGKTILLEYISYDNLISCNEGDQIKIWNITSSSKENEKFQYSIFQEFSKPSSRIMDISMNSNNKNILASLKSGSLIRWDIGTEYHDKVDKTTLLTLTNERIKNADKTTLLTLTNERKKNIVPPNRNFWGEPYQYYKYAISPDGSRIAIAVKDNNIIVWNSNFQDFNALTIHGHEYRINDIVFSNNGKYLATSSIDKTLKLWDLNTGEILKSFEFTNDWVTKIAFLNNMIICGTYRGDIIIRDIF